MELLQEPINRVYRVQDDKKLKNKNEEAKTESGMLKSDGKFKTAYMELLQKPTGFR